MFVHTCGGTRIERGNAPISNPEPKPRLPPPNPDLLVASKESGNMIRRGNLKIFPYSLLTTSKLNQLEGSWMVAGSYEWSGYWGKI